MWMNVKMSTLKEEHVMESPDKIALAVDIERDGVIRVDELYTGFQYRIIRLGDDGRMAQCWLGGKWRNLRQDTRLTMLITAIAYHARSALDYRIQQVMDVMDIEESINNVRNNS